MMISLDGTSIVVTDKETFQQNVIGSVNLVRQLKWEEKTWP